MLFIEYPKCTTCKKAKKFLDDHGLSYVDRDIKTDNPTAEELATWYPKTGKKIERFFNTSGLVYRNNNYKDLLPSLSDQEKFELLASDGMLVKRPLLVLDDRVLIGFKEAEWEEALLK
ncbi:MAG: Spx/MgsR family RNA polymerase-binding regulatory protein [Veillonella sp.]|nr:Spx/MgsR family RNA polymerase-binding regulatory protein [Veillonella sp.]MCF0156203.1 Spx/MgsR family RNA polymerase-binding regulatory protein [Veillonella sp.]